MSKDEIECCIGKGSGVDVDGSCGIVVGVAVAGVMALIWLGSACGCVRWIGMPPLPPGSFNDTALYGVAKNKWGANVNRARKLIRQP